MEILRKYIWVWVIIGMIFVSVVISLIFLLINKCITRRGKHRISQLQRGPVFPVESNKYKERNFDTSTPPLPPRTQFLTAEAQSYENLAEAPEREQALPQYEQNTNNYEQPLPEYEQDMNNYEQPLPEYEQDMNNYEQPLPEYEQDVNDYEQVLPEYEQKIDELSDYVKVEDEEEILPPPPQYDDPYAASDNASTEDYDDIGGEDENQEEDYDDVA